MTASTRKGRDRDAGRRRVACGSARPGATGTNGLRGLQPEPSRTLEDLVVEAWTALRGDTYIACPWCDSAMEPRWSAGAGVVGGRCRRCGTELA
jgi:tRNA(Ile2) C34 agmatinyltransferase TiaS